MVVVPLDNNIVIIGGGVAAINAIKAIREYNNESIIHVFQNEKFYPYYRIRLTKSLFEDLDIDKILLQKREWYELNNVHLYLDKEISAVDTSNNKILLTNGSSFEYDKLLLANGANNFKPPIEGIDQEGVYSIRRYEDILNIQANTHSIDTILCLGGGIQNLEAAWALSSQGKKVIIAEFMEKLMPRQLDTRGSEILRKAVVSQGIKIFLSTQIIKITGEDSVNGVTTKNGQNIECDMIIYSVGIRPNIKIYENTDIEVNLGVVVDDRMRTNIQNIYAAGDIAELNGKVGGLWTIAAEQGKVAGYNIVGTEAVYHAVIPVTTMNAFNLSIFSVGNVDENSCSQTLTEDNEDGLSYKRIFIHNDKIIGAIIIGESKYNTLLKNLVVNETELHHIDFANSSINELLDQLKSN
jgi:nitrite reductase (NADH) large subunit